VYLMNIIKIAVKMLENRLK